MLRSIEEVEAKYLRLVKKWIEEGCRWLKNEENLESNELVVGWKKREIRCRETRITGKNLFPKNKGFVTSESWIQKVQHVFFKSYLRRYECFTIKIKNVKKKCKQFKYSWNLAVDEHLFQEVKRSCRLAWNEMNKIQCCVAQRSNS